MSSPMSPGTYLRKRREAAGFTIDQIVIGLAIQPDTLRPLSHADMVGLASRLTEAEADRDNLTVIQASLLLRFFSFDAAVYEALLLSHYAGRDSALPEPQVCRGCACSWHDPCLVDPFPGAPAALSGKCAWSANDPTLCTVCAKARADWPDAPLPEAFGPEALAPVPSGEVGTGSTPGGAGHKQTSKEPCHG